MAHPNHETIRQDNAHRIQHLEIWIRNKLSTIDAVIEIESFISDTNRGLQLLLMGLPKAIGAINRTPSASPDSDAQKGNTHKHDCAHKGRRREVQLRGKQRGEYGTQVPNNAGVFQGSSISTLLYILYLDL